MDISFLDTIYILSRKENEKVGASTRCISLIVAGTLLHERRDIESCTAKVKLSFLCSRFVLDCPSRVSYTLCCTR